MPVLHGCLVAFMENRDDGPPRAGACPGARLKQISRLHGTQTQGAQEVAEIMGERMELEPDLFVAETVVG